MYSVYKLTDKNGLVYYGSTDNPERRFSEHKSSRYNSCCSRKMDSDSIEMYILKEGIATENEALWIERDYFENNECVNANRPIITEEELKIMRREYYDNNKEECHKRHRKYYYNNKEEILIRQKEYYEKKKEELIKKQKEYYEKNKEALAKRRKENNKRNKEIKLMGLEDKIEI